MLLAHSTESADNTAPLPRSPSLFPHWACLKKWTSSWVCLQLLQVAFCLRSSLFPLPPSSYFVLGPVYLSVRFVLFPASIRAAKCFLMPYSVTLCLDCHQVSSLLRYFFDNSPSAAQHNQVQTSKGERCIRSLSNSCFSSLSDCSCGGKLSL